MLKWLKRLFCNHTWTWAERRQAEVCVNCGTKRRDQP